MIFYKIRSKSTGLYRCAGGEPKWTKSGKVFDTLGKIRLFVTNCINHNQHYAHGRLVNDFSDWQVVEYEANENEIKDVHEILKAETIIKMLKK